MSVTLRPDFPNAPKVDLEWRGKSVRLLTPDEVLAFADWAYREHGRLREERDRYLGRAVRAEAELRTENDCGNDPAYDTREERDMDLGIEGRRARSWEE